MRYPSNVAYRNNNRTATNGGFQSRSGRNSAAGRMASYRGANIRPIGARANDNPLFRTYKPEFKKFGKKTAHRGASRAAAAVSRGRFIAGAVVRGVPLGLAVNTAINIIDMIPGVEKNSWDIPRLRLVVDGGGWYRTAGSWYYGGVYAGQQPTVQSIVTYTKDLSGQFITGEPIGEPMPYHRQKFGLWIKSEGIDPARYAHHSSYRRDVISAGDVHIRMEPVWLPANSVPFISTAYGVNPAIAPLTIPSRWYPFPESPFAVRTGRQRRFREETDSGPSPSSRGQQKKHKSSRPPRGTKEKKLIAAISGRSALGQVVSGIGEGIEYIDILAGAVDFNYRITDGTVGSSEVPDQLWRLQKQKWARQRANGERLTKLTPQEKAKFVYDYFNYIDWNKAATGFLLNGIEDKIFGAIGQQGAKANRRSDRIVGYQFGYAL